MEPVATPPDMPSQEPATYSSRFSAFMIDFLIHGWPALAYLLIQFLPCYLIGSLDGSLGWVKVIIWSLAAWEAAFLIPQIYLLQRYGQTIGKRLCSIRVATCPSGTNNGILLNGLVRLLVPWGLFALAGYYSFYAGILLWLADTGFIFWRKRCLHDYLAFTHVVRTNPGDLDILKTRPPWLSWPWFLQAFRNPAARISLAVILGLGLAYGVYAGNNWWNTKKTEEARLAEERKPHDAMMEKIRKLRTESRELPACPLIYPLLDSSGNISQVGSYLSFLAMQRAAYLPRSVFRLPDVGDIFDTFQLFNPAPGPCSKYYFQELPFRFQARDFADGTWEKTAKGYQVRLRFWGTRPEKKYLKKFGGTELHLVPAWMASCLHDWAGFRPTAQQADYLSRPVFANDVDFKRGAAAEWIIRRKASLVLDWDKVLANNPDSAFLNERRIAVAADGDEKKQTDLVRELLGKHPDDTFLKVKYAGLLVGYKNYNKGLELLFGELMRDNNNSFLYQKAVTALEGMNYWEEDIALLRTWALKHPDNPEPWMFQADAWIGWGWVARGSDTADKVTPEGWRLLKERMNWGVWAAARSTQLAPRDCRTWSHLLRYGVSCEWEKATLWNLFNKAVGLYPYRYNPYRALWNLLHAKWMGSDEEDEQFRKKYEVIFPEMVLDLATDSFFKDYVEGDSAQQRIDRRKRLVKNVTESPYWDEYERAMHTYFRANPLDTDKWTNFFYWVGLRGQLDRELAFAREVIPDDPELRKVYPFLVLQAIGQDLAAQGTDADIEKLKNDPKTVTMENSALKQLCGMEPDNWCHLNRWAKLCVDHHFEQDGRLAFRAIGDHWDKLVWTREEFDKAKKSLNIK